MDMLAIAYHQCSACYCVFLVKEHVMEIAPFLKRLQVSIFSFM